MIPQFGLQFIQMMEFLKATVEKSPLGFTLMVSTHLTTQIKIGLFHVAYNDDIA